jgi:prepilin-type N-terminal cleavage/methylation domain-containing protein/prepilin-type processing-associated H-X9-DG protein
MTKNCSRGFTLLELFVVMVIIAILASIAYPAFLGALERAKVTKDMNNLRQIGIATQLYMNDNDGALFSTTGSWMTQLYPKYTAAWGIFQSPFDTRAPSEAGTAAPVSPISYGINGTAGLIGTAADKITKPTIFILFAPAQAPGATVTFLGLATDVPGATVLGNGGGTATSVPGGAAAAGTQNNRTRINALFADLHVETMVWSLFTANTNNPPSDPCGAQRWNPTATCP